MCSTAAGVDAHFLSHDECDDDDDDDDDNGDADGDDNDDVDDDNDDDVGDDGDDDNAPPYPTQSRLSSMAAGADAHFLSHPTFTTFFYNCNCPPNNPIIVTDMYFHLFDFPKRTSCGL